MAVIRWVGRGIGLDVHRDFCEVAFCRDGEVRSAGRVPATPEGVGSLAESLLPSDRVALEVTGSCWEIARILEPHVNRVVVVSPDDTGHHQARLRGRSTGRATVGPPRLTAPREPCLSHKSSLSFSHGTSWLPAMSRMRCSCSQPVRVARSPSGCRPSSP